MRLTIFESAGICSNQGLHERAAGLFAKAGAPHVEDTASEYYAAGLPKEALCHLFDSGHYESVINGLTGYASSYHDNRDIQCII